MKYINLAMYLYWHYIYYIIIIIMIIQLGFTQSVQITNESTEF